MIIFLIIVISLICIIVIYFILPYHNNLFYKQFSFFFFPQLILIQNNTLIYRNNFRSLISFQNNVFHLRGYIFMWYKYMNQTFTVISTLIKSNITEKCLINFLMNVSSKRLHLFTMELHLKRKRNLLKWLFMDVWLEH